MNNNNYFGKNIDYESLERNMLKEREMKYLPLSTALM